MPAVYTKHQIRLIAATDGLNYRNKIIERDDQLAQQVERSDVAAVISGTAQIADAASLTIKLDENDIAKVRFIYIETDGQVKISLLDNDAAANELTAFVVGGSTASTAGLFFCECDSFTIAAGDTFVIANASGAVRTVTYWLGGTTT